MLRSCRCHDVLDIGTPPRSLRAALDRNHLKHSCVADRTQGIHLENERHRNVELIFDLLHMRRQRIGHSFEDPLGSSIHIDLEFADGRTWPAQAYILYRTLPSDGSRTIGVMKTLHNEHLVNCSPYCGFWVTIPIN